MAFDLSKIEARLGSFVKDFDGMVAQVGIPVGLDDYPDTGEKVAAVAAQNEFGAPEMRIPARPFFAPTIANNKEQWVKITEKQLARYAQGNGDVYSVLDPLAITASEQVKETIAGIYDPPLAEYTLEQRRARGNQSTKPLNDTGRMVASISWAVNKEDAEFKK